MIQGTVHAMGTIHSTSKNEQSRPSRNDLHLVRQEIAKLFAMDSHNHRANQQTFKGHQNSNRWNILRFLESVKRETILGDMKLDVTAANSCSSSPVMPTFPQLGQYRSNIEDSCENLITNAKTKSPQYLPPGVEYRLKKSERRDFSVNDDFKEESQVSCVLGLDSLHIDKSTTNDDSSNSTKTSKGRSRPIPVSRRRMSRNITNNEESYIDHTTEESRLKQIYDLRTWEMYIRISEARKKNGNGKSKVLDYRSICISNTAAAATGNPGTVEQISYAGSTLPIQGGQLGGQHFDMNHLNMIPFLTHEDATEEQSTLLLSPSSEHEMIFGDLDD